MEDSIKMKLRTVNQISEATEWLFNQQKENKVDPKSADGMNTTLKNSIYLNVKLRMDAAQLWFKAAAKKLEIPKGMLPE